jgi:hypothetical protein
MDLEIFLGGRGQPAARLLATFQDLLFFGTSSWKITGNFNLR